MLQLVQDEMGHEEGPFEKSRFTEIGHPSVDDDARVEDLGTDGVAIQLKEFLLGAWQLLLAEPGAQHEAEIRESEKKDEAADMEQEGLDVENLAAHPFDRAPSTPGPPPILPRLRQ